jgi:Cu/Ag efflux pump CusA
LRQRREEDGGLSVEDTIIDASVEIRGTMIFATLILVLAVVPVFVLPDETGSFYSPLAGSYALAVLASMVVALTLTPALSSILWSDGPSRRHSPLTSWLQGGYERALSKTVEKTRIAYVAVAVLTVVSLVLLAVLNQSVSPLPDFRQRNIKIDVDGAPGTSRPEMDRIVGRIGDELRTVPGVRNVAAHVGRAILGDQVVGINSSQLWVSIDPGANYDETLAQIQETVDGYPGLHNEVQTYLNEIGSAVETEPLEDVVVRVFGEKQDVLRSVAEEVHQAIAGIDGIDNAQLKLPVEEPTLEIEVDLEAAQRYGLNPGDVRRAAATMVSGLQVGSLFEEQKVFEVSVWSTPETRHSLSDVGELLIDTPDGGRVRLAEVADVRVAASPSVMRRLGVSSYLEITADVRGRDLGAVSNDVKRTLRGFPFPLEYHAALVTERVERQAARQLILFAGIFAALGIFLLQQAAFDSWRLATLTFVTLPWALMGGLLAAFVSGGTLGLGSLAGLLAVLGLALRNGMMLIGHYQHLSQYEGGPFGPALVLRGSRERLIPILMTTLAIGLALLPVVIFGNIPGHEVLQPMAVVILGGLVTSALLNLFVLPTLYLRFGFSPESVAVPHIEPVKVS